MISRLLSGGQTGVDRAALDAAVALGIPHGGFCPRGRLAEDGAIPAHYALTEAPTADYAGRTRQNVSASEACLILSWGEPTGGTLLTVSLCQQRWGRAEGDWLRWDMKWLHSFADVARSLRQWVTWHAGQKALLVAGPRQSKAPGIYEACKALLLEVLR